MLVVGGCHVGAYLLPQQADGFVAAAVRSLPPGLKPQVRTLFPVSPKQAPRILEVIDAWEPHVLVLQLGNWEALRELIRRKGIAAQVKPRIASLIPRPIYWSLKSVYDRMKRHSQVDRPRVSEQYAALFRCISERGVARVFVLKPFPTMDPVVRHYRCDMAEIIAEQGAAYGFDVTDATREIWPDGEAQPRREYFLDDGVHLNAAGHRAVAAVLAGALLRTGKTAAAKSHAVC